MLDEECRRDGGIETNETERVLLSFEPYFPLMAASRTYLHMQNIGPYPLASHAETLRAESGIMHCSLLHLITSTRPAVAARYHQW